MLNQDLTNKFNSVDYTRFLPMGRVSSFARNYAKVMAPESLDAGRQMFQGMMRQRQIQQRALAAAYRAQQQFQKVWPKGRSEELINNFVNKKR